MSIRLTSFPSYRGTYECRIDIWKICILSVVIFVFSTPAHSEVLYGYARVSDADTIKIQGERIRFTGIDAPETKQYCRRSDGTSYRCGKEATDALISRIDGMSVKCDLQEERDRYGRRLGTCYFNDGENMSAWLVRNGHAVAARKYSDRYVSDELLAQAAKKGIWSGDFVLPWRWRQGQRLQ